MLNPASRPSPRPTVTPVRAVIVESPATPDAAPSASPVVPYQVPVVSDTPASVDMSPEELFALLVKERKDHAATREICGRMSEKAVAAEAASGRAQAGLNSIRDKVYTLEARVAEEMLSRQDAEAALTALKQEVAQGQQYGKQDAEGREAKRMVPVSAASTQTLGLPLW